jgi:hypothetical protein
MLAELQGRLFLVEIGESLSRLQGAGLVVLAGCILGLATAPILLVTLALALIELTAMSPAGAFALVSLLALLISASMVVVGSRRLRGAVTVPRSSLECELNWNWLKTTLREESAAASKPQSSSKR